MFLTGMKYVARCNVILKKLVYQFMPINLSITWKLHLRQIMTCGIKPIFSHFQIKWLMKMCCRVYLAVSTNAENRGLMVQQGCVKVQLQSHGVDCSADSRL